MSSRSSVALSIAIALGLILGSVGIFGLTKLFGPFPFSITQTTTAKQSSFDVQGETTITTTPDKAVTNIGITINDTSVQGAQNKANATINSITEAISRLGIDKKDIKTEQYNLYPTYENQLNATQRISGYTVTISLSVSVRDFEKLNDVIDTATRLGANQISGVSFMLSEEKQKDIEDQARKEAIDHAKQKAETLAKLSGLRLGKIINVIEQPQFRGGPIPLMMKAEVAPDTAQTSIQPGSTTIHYTVTLSYETL